MTRPDSNNDALEAAVSARFESDPERTRLAQLLDQQYEHLKQTQEALYARDELLIREEKQRLGLPDELTDLECLRAEAHYGIG